MAQGSMAEPEPGSAEEVPFAQLQAELDLPLGDRAAAVLEERRAESWDAVIQS